MMVRMDWFCLRNFSVIGWCEEGNQEYLQQLLIQGDNGAQVKALIDDALQWLPGGIHIRTMSWTSRACWFISMFVRIIRVAVSVRMGISECNDGRGDFRVGGASSQ